MDLIFYLLLNLSSFNLSLLIYSLLNYPFLIYPLIIQLLLYLAAFSELLLSVKSIKDCLKFSLYSAVAAHAID